MARVKSAVKKMGKGDKAAKKGFKGDMKKTVNTKQRNSKLPVGGKKGGGPMLKVGGKNVMGGTDH
jgi:hypothetical protein